jgi:hypothetical protein
VELSRVMRNGRGAAVVPPVVNSSQPSLAHIVWLIGE